ncbi:SurA N-terminal domain-containing protein [Haloferula rosea]|uniref:SurA N-terminal domain-containing protein n=1 Tax=Haloferula rosea TaxID=490093 RepID=A0A934VER4_9BACT|nr:SurA N-terminal domain-containing protein [Haloferula rosea]MBK1827599.1 SurA N-terminal domain-containing protein [Haloferula rosea]
MIENIRKYTGLIIVVIVLLLLGFLFMDTSGFFRQSAAGATYATVDGRNYSQSEFINIGSSPMQMTGSIRSFDPNGLEIMRFSRTLMGNAESEENAALNFFAGRLIIQKAAKDFGIHTSAADIREFIEGLQMFQSQPPVGSAPGTQGDFDQVRYNQFIKNLGAYGMVERDFQSLVSDVIVAAKLREILGGGLTGSTDLAKAMAVVTSQQITAEIAVISADAIREKIKPTDEELMAYWETLKDAYQTEKRVKVSYLLTSPTYSAEASEPEEEASDAEKTDEQKAADEEAKAKRAELRKAEDKKFAVAIDSFITEVGSSEGKDFEKLIEDNGWQLVSTDWLTTSTLPDDLKLTTRGASAGKTISDYIFELKTGPDPLAPFTNVIGVGTNQWLVVRLDELDEPRTKTFEEAKEEITERYISEKVNEALTQDVEAKGNALKEAVAAGDSFEEAAKGLGLETKTLGPWGVSDPLPEEAAGREIFQLASTVNPGEFAEPLIEDDRAVIIHVVKREILKDDNRGQQYDRFASQFEVQNENAAFAGWLDQQLEDADIKGPQGR